MTKKNVFWEIELKTVWLTYQTDASLLFLQFLSAFDCLFFCKMLQCRHFKFCTSGMLSYHNFINRRFFRKLTSCVSFKGGEYDNVPWCLNHSFTLTSVVFKPHFSLCQMLSKARGSWWAQSNSVTVRYPAVPRVCMCVSSLCLYLETGKVCRSKSLRKAALIPSCVASTWNGCKWTNGNQPLFFPSLYADCLRQKARGAQQEVRDLIIRRRLCGCTYFLLELSSRPYQIFFFQLI